MVNCNINNKSKWNIHNKITNIIIEIRKDYFKDKKNRLKMWQSMN